MRWDSFFSDPQLYRINPCSSLCIKAAVLAGQLRAVDRFCEAPPLRIVQDRLQLARQPVLLPVLVYMLDALDFPLCPGADVNHFANVGKMVRDKNCTDCHFKERWLYTPYFDRKERNSIFNLQKKFSWRETDMIAELVIKQSKTIGEK